MNASKPDPEQFSRVMLWHLSQLRASVDIMQSDALYAAGKAAGATDEEILQATATHGKRVRIAAESFYLDGLKQSNIKPSPLFPLPPPE